MSLIQLPVPPDEWLSQAPLSLVVCQVRFEHLTDVDNAERIVSLSRELPGGPWSLQERKSNGITVHATSRELRAEGGSAPPWRLRAPDGQWVIAIHNEFVALETASYTRWKEFRLHFRTLIELLDTYFSPQIEHRLGVRFVNEIPAPNQVRKPSGWHGWVEDSFLGLAVDTRFTEAVTQFRQTVELSVGDGQKVLLNHGAAESDDSESVYILDIDCYRQLGRSFEVEEIATSADHLHDLEKRVFRAAVTDQLYDHLKGQKDG